MHVTILEAFPILNILAPHSPHLPRVAGRPFFIVTCSASCISRLSLHFRQYPVIANSFHSLSCEWPSSIIDAAGSVQEAGLDAGVAPGSSSSRVLRWWWRFDIVGAVHPQPMDDLNRVLLVSIRVGLRFLKERSQQLRGRVLRLHGPVTLQARYGQPGFQRSSHRTSS